MAASLQLYNSAIQALSQPFPTIRNGARNVIAPVPQHHHSTRNTEILSTGTLSLPAMITAHVKTDTAEQARAHAASSTLVGWQVVGTGSERWPPTPPPTHQVKLMQKLTLAITFTMEAHMSFPTSSATLALSASESLGTGSIDTVRVSSAESDQAPLFPLTVSAEQ